jgi:hypothetical protein
VRSRTGRGEDGARSTNGHLADDEAIEEQTRSQRLERFGAFILRRSVRRGIASELAEARSWSRSEAGAQ